LGLVQKHAMCCNNCCLRFLRWIDAMLLLKISFMGAFTIKRFNRPKVQVLSKDYVFSFELDKFTFLKWKKESSALVCLRFCSFFLEGTQSVIIWRGVARCAPLGVNLNFLCWGGLQRYYCVRVAKSRYKCLELCVYTNPKIIQ
jgi:hypothetical protein